MNNQKPSTSKARPVSQLLPSLLPILLLALSPALRAAEPVLKNAGFEEGTAGWNIRAAEGVKADAVAEAAHDGIKGLFVEDATPDTGLRIISDPFTVSPGASYQVSFWGKAVEGIGCTVYLVYYDEKNHPLNKPGKADGADAITANIGSKKTDWTPYNLGGPAPGGAATAALWIMTVQKSTGKFQLDDFTITAQP